MKKLLAENLARKGIDPAVLDTPNARLENQAGETDDPLPNDEFESGLR